MKRTAKSAPFVVVWTGCSNRAKSKKQQKNNQLEEFSIHARTLLVREIMRMRYLWELRQRNSQGRLISRLAFCSGLRYQSAWQTIQLKIWREN